MRRVEYPTLILLILLSTGLYGQETLDPLNAGQFRKSAQQRSSGLNELFLYQNLAQDLPIMDDFSIDRTRHLDAQSGDSNVSLNTIVYRLDSSGFSTPRMEFAATHRTRTTYDTISFPDSTAITIDTLPSFMVDVYDIGSFPSTFNTETVWMPWDIIDSVVSGGTLSDTIFQIPADLTQDSLLVYDVAPDARTCNCSGSPKPLILWQDDDAFVNATYPVDPPTLGVASLEGLNRNGYPYDFFPASTGRADKLTSVPINLQSSPADSVYLSFFYQPQGLSGDNVVQVEDSLYLEFFDVVNNEWEQRWSVGYSALQPFKQVMIPILEFEYLMNGFQFRFVNEGSLAGALDHWHIDYVRLARQRSFNDTLLVDVSYVMPESSLLATYTSVPYQHYVAATNTFMASEILLDQKNLDVADRFITYGMRTWELSDPSGTFVDFPTNGNNISNNASSTFVSTHPINSAPNSYTYPNSANDSCAFWRTQFYTNATPDINRCNDTITMVQELSSYYAYDDGTAEAGYNLNVSGAKLAYEFDMTQPDTLVSVRMYFDPIFEDASTGSFLITIWSDIQNETIIHQNVSFSSPQYTQDGLNRFVDYPLDSAVVVPNKFYVGWVQTSSDKMNIGFDRNRDNSDKIWFNVSTVFQPSVLNGSLMMRPVMASDKDPFLSVQDMDEISKPMVLSPNPSDGQFTVRFSESGAAQLRLFDSAGRMVMNRSVVSGEQIAGSNLDNGMYIIQLYTLNGELKTSRLVIRK